MSTLRLSEAAAHFLATIPPSLRAESQQELNKFVRWCGGDRPPGELKANEIAHYAETVGGPGPLKRLAPVRAFLMHVRKQGLASTNLAVHLRVRKTSSKSAAAREQPADLLTPQGMADLKAELEALKGQRPRIAQELAKARADKDFRENAPLDAARDAQGQLEARIRELERVLRASAVAEEKNRTEKAGLGNTLTLKDLASGEELRYALVGSSEANLLKGKLSVSSLTGKALLDRREGETVEVTAPAGVQRYQILRIEP